LVELCLAQGFSRRRAAAWRHVSVSTVQFWIERYRQAAPEERASGAWAQDRPSTPHHQPGRVDDATHDRVCEQRRRTGWGPRLIASELGMSHATVSRCLQRRGLSRMPRPAREEVCRYEWPCPGDLLQMDTKQFANFSRPGHAVTGDRHRTGAEKRMKVGKQIAHSMIDDHSRLAYTELHRDEKAATVTAFVDRALAFFAAHGITARRLQTDNAWSYIHNTSLAGLLATRAITHRRIPPRTPKRNGKVERYQQTLKREWALGQTYKNSAARDAALDAWLTHYNYTRNHSSLDNRPPITRVRNDPRHDT
jgi:transposase InsO family protein